MELCKDSRELNDGQPLLQTGVSTIEEDFLKLDSPFTYISIEDSYPEG